jgi:hypothetical protein
MPGLVSTPNLQSDIELLFFFSLRSTRFDTESNMKITFELLGVAVLLLRYLCSSASPPCRGKLPVSISDHLRAVRLLWLVRISHPAMTPTKTFTKVLGTSSTLRSVAAASKTPRLVSYPTGT